MISAEKFPTNLDLTAELNSIKQLGHEGKIDPPGVQQGHAGGQTGIFGVEAQRHDASIKSAMDLIKLKLDERYPKLDFRHRRSISKKEINIKLQSIDKRLGKVLFVQKSSIRPDGGIIEVQDRYGNYRVVLISESKHQGNDVEKIKAGIKQGKHKDADLMVAGNAIERVHKNILELRNYMLDELHFPYVIFLQGSNFATNTFYAKSPSGRKVKISHDAGHMNRIDRVTSSNFGMDINRIYCQNEFLELNGKSQMLQIPSLFFQAESWSNESMVNVLWESVSTSMNMLSENLVDYE